MTINSLISLTAATDYPINQVGPLAKDLAKIAKLGLTVSPGLIIPKETLDQLLFATHLTSKLQLLATTTAWDDHYIAATTTKKIKKMIVEQKLPEDFSVKLIKKIDELSAKNKYFKVIAGENFQENISGSVNVIESVLEIWAQSYDPKKQTFAPIVILGQGEPESAGIAYLDKEQKNHIIIEVMKGVWNKNSTTKSDKFVLDLRSEAIISRELGANPYYYRRGLDKLIKVSIKAATTTAISDSQAQAVAAHCLKINRSHLSQIKISFEIIKGKVVVTGASEATTQAKTTDQTALVIGQSVTGGVIEGLATVVKSPYEKNSFPTGNILVIRELNHLDQGLILQAAAIVVEVGQMTAAALKIISENHIPCIVGATYATTKIRSGEKIIVQAGLGKVFRLTAQPQKTRSEQTLTKIYLSAGNPYKSAETGNGDGIFLKSDYAIAFIGIHPNHLLSTNRHQFSDNLKRTISAFMGSNPLTPFFYRSCNLNSAELGALHNATPYEKVEPNPYLGNRGALKIIEDQTLFAAELETVAQLASEKRRTINFVIPFVRTASELAIIFKKIEQLAPGHPYLKFWLQLNTPANVLNLAEFLRFPIAGISIQIKTIHDLAYGLDPDNNDLSQFYSFDNELAANFIKEIVATAGKAAKIPVILKLNSYHSPLVTLAAELGIRAVVVKPPLFAIVKEQLLATQDKILSKVVKKT